MSSGGHDGKAARAVAALSGACAQYRVAVIGAWVLLVLALVTAAGVLGTPTDNDVSLPGTDAQLVRDLTTSPDAAGSTSGLVIVVAPDGQRLLQDALAATADSLRRAGHVTTVKPPAKQEGSLSGDERTGWFTVGLDVRRAELTKPMARAVVQAASPAADAGLRVLPGGGAIEAQAAPCGVAELMAAGPGSECHFADQFRSHPVRGASVLTRHWAVEGVDRGGERRRRRRRRSRRTCPDIPVPTRPT
ncbi:hypothetical protein SAMN05216188_13051 [Lentzea xinjiangensis]|uniref:MMPL family protein n=1 Tax=Lentzea xinjiangensis TaxID=402600 RepID=A0A1H9W3B9_9PSEU|nr:hypothetical protein SAMN05216188_13051 [Lentzea xinjiangensis]